jgi:DNA invertase Pin-like site-specific DNA recombinase
MNGSAVEEIRVFGYLRTSTDDGKQQDSPEVQEHKIRKYCEEKGWELVSTYTDLLTGKTPLKKRPMFQRMLDEAKAKGVRGLVSISTDRVLRSTKLLFEIDERLNEHELFLYGIDDRQTLGLPLVDGRLRAPDKFMRTVLAAGNQMWSDFTGDKIKDKQEYRVHELKLHSGGAPPFGYRVRRDEVHPETGKHVDVWGPDDDSYGDPGGPLGRRTGAEWIKYTFESFRKCESLMDIANALTEAQVPPPRLLQWNRLSKAEQERRIEAQARRKAAGKQTMHLPPLPFWDSSVLSDILRSRTYLGEVPYTPLRPDRREERIDRRWYPGLHPAIVDLETFDAVQAILNVKNGGKRRSVGAKEEVLLSGMLRCSCGMGAMTKVSRHEENDDFNYTCNFNKKTRGKACENPRKSGRAVHDAAFLLLKAGLLGRRDALLKHPPIPKSPDDSLNKAIQAKVEERERVKRAVIAGALDEDEGFAELSRLKVEIEALKKAIFAEAQPDTTVQELETFLNNLGKCWDDLDFFVKRDLLRSYAPEGFILDHGILRGKVCGFQFSVKVEVGKRGGERLKLEGFYTTHDAATKLGVSPQYIDQLVREGKLPAERRQTGKLMKKFIPCDAVEKLAEVRKGNCPPT